MMGTNFVSDWPSGWAPRLGRGEVGSIPTLETTFYAPLAQLEEVLRLERSQCQFESDEGYQLTRHAVF